MKLTRNQASGTLNATVEDCCMVYHVKVGFEVSRFYPATFHSPAEGGEVEPNLVEIWKAEVMVGDDLCEVTPVGEWPQALLEHLSERLVQDDDFCDRAREHTGVY